MSVYEKPLFSVHSYDKDGHITESGIFIHVGNTALKVADDVYGLREFIGQLESCADEIEENYSL